MDLKSRVDVIQCNLDRSKSCLQEFTRFFMSSKHSFALISEPYIGAGNEVKPIHGLQIFQFPGPNKVKSCIFSKVNDTPVIGISQFSSANLCVVQFSAGSRKVFLASVYIEPDEDILGALAGVESFVGQIGGASCIIGGDFNGWHPLWGSSSANERGRAVAEVAYGRDLYVCNVGSVPTFETVTHGRVRSSIIDITLASADVADWVTGWRVSLEGCPSSQHNAVEFGIVLDRRLDGSAVGTSTFRYNSEKAQWAEFKSSLHTRISLADTLEYDINTMDAAQLDNFIDHITDIIHEACQDSMPVKTPGGRHKPPWWTDDLEARKEEVISQHRRLHSAKKHHLPTESLAVELGTLKVKYAEELRNASSANFRAFCELQSKENVWSLTNRLLKDSNPRRPPTTFKVGDKFTKDSEETARALLDHFFPDDPPDTLDRHHELRRQTHNVPDTPEDPPFTTDEVLEALKAMNPKKAPGLDGLTSDICLQFAAAYPTLLTDLFNRCLTLQYFPQKWKTAYVKIIPKPNKHSYTSLESHRPIGLIPVFGKLFEKLFVNRVTFAAAKTDKLNPRQFGFKPQTSTTMAIDTALQTIRQAKTRGEMVVAVSLDIKAAFDNAWWPALLHRLRHVNCPRNIYNLIDNYLQNRQVILDHAGGRVTKVASKGCTQGSTCGPILWNIILDELLSVELPTGCHIQAFADDVLLITHAKHADELQEITCRALDTILRWGRGVKLDFGPAKTKLVAFTPKAKATSMVMDGQTLRFEGEVKFLGVVIDEKLLFNRHLHYIINKAMRIFNKLCLYCRPTWGAHPENVQTIYRQVIEPIVTYAAGIWGQVAYKKGVRQKLLSMQRAFAIRVIKSYRTVSTTAAIALANFTPLDLKVREVHAIETARLTGTTSSLPRDITLERNTPPHHLLHPAHRLTLTHEPFSNEGDIRKHYTTQNSIHIYTDGSKLEDSSVGAAFVCYAGDRELTRRKFKLHSSCSVFQAELLAIHRACLWASAHTKTIHVVIFSDSMAALLAMGNRSNTHPLVSATHQIIHNHHITHHSTTQLAWVRSHVGIPGNEAADAAAKSAAKLRRAVDYAHFPVSHVKHWIRTQNRHTWQARYESAQQGHHTRKLLPKIDDIRRLWTLTKPNFYLTQALTGHGCHRDYLHRFKLTANNLCPCDGSSAQTLSHLFEHCPRFARTRNKHIALCDYLELPPFEITQLLRKFVALESYVELANSILSNVKEFNKSI